MEAAIRRAKNWKAMGWDMIPNEFFEQEGNSMLTLLTFRFNTILMSEYTPGKWRECYTRLLHKGGDRTKLDNYGGIPINSNVGKLFTRVITRRMEEDVETRGLLGECEFGFRKGERAIDAVFILSQLIESRRK